jgi:GTP-binding protein
LLDKKRLLAISKSDMLDDELKEALQKELPHGIPWVFVSGLKKEGLRELKELIWQTLKG